VITLGIVAPIAAYLVLRQVLHSDGYALGISEIVLLVWTLAVGGRRGHLNPVVIATAVILAIALVLTVLAGGSALPLKLRRGAITGPLGLACLISVVIRRPLLPALLDLAAQSGPTRLAQRLRSVRASLSDQAASGLTAIVGLTLLADAVVQVTLAFTISTTVFVAITGLIRLALAVVGVGVCVVYLRAQRPAPPEPGSRAPSLAQRP
jgi:hypothetical protein